MTTTEGRTEQNVDADAQDAPIWGNPMDWITFFVLIITLLDHIRRSIWGTIQRKRRHSGIFEETLDEPPQKSPLRHRKKHKKHKKENKKHNRHDDPGEKARKPTAPSGINFYDLAKIWAIGTMVIDHYGYFGLPGISWTAARWTRVIGRTSAPMFFFLIGYSGSFRFRWHTYCYAVFLFVCNGWLNLRLTATSFESLVIVLSVNMLFQWIDLEKILNKHWIFHIILFAALAVPESYSSDYLRIAYGSQAYMLIITGLLTKRGNRFAKFWAIGTMIQYAYLACAVFGRTPAMFNAIIALITMECFVFMFANKLGGKHPYSWSPKLPVTVRDFLLYVSRNALIVYVVHLQMFRLIQMKTWNW